MVPDSCPVTQRYGETLNCHASSWFAAILLIGQSKKITSPSVEKREKKLNVFTLILKIYILANHNWIIEKSKSLTLFFYVVNGHSLVLIS